jgi:pilus assembly protein FimV
MVQVRKLVLAIAAASALSSGMARALDLGEVTLKSAVNQPLVAEIELLDVRDLTAAEIKPTLATDDDFAKAGIEHKAFLNGLTFTPVINPGGKSIIRVTSDQPLTEPMVKFLVQVLWPNGRLMRDYSVLLDPSKFSPQAAQAAQGGIAPAVSAPNAGAAAQFTTSKHDTLWDIAQKNRQGASVQQTMLAIQALNPDAFIDGNINRLKVGQVLRLPDGSQSTALPQAQAIAEVARQNAAWREGRRLGPRARQLDATRKAGPGSAPAQVNTQDKLSLVAAEGADAKGNAGDRLSNKLAVTQEKLDTTRRDNAELKDRMGDLQSQLDKLQKLIQLKNDQLAKLQAAGAADGSPAQGAAASAPAADAATAPIAAQLAPAPATAAAPEASAPATAPASPPAVQAPADNPPGALEKLLASPMLVGLLGGAGVIVFLLLLLLLARRRKAQQESEKHMRMARALAEESEFNEDPHLPLDSFEGLETPAPNVKLAPAMVAASAAAAVASAEPAPVTAPQPSTIIPTPPLRPAAEPKDETLVAAEQAIAEGHFNDADDLLEAAVKHEPQRSDLRLKLMEVYAQQGDRDAFVAQERQLVANGQNHADVEKLKSRYPAMIGVAVVAAGAAALAAELDAQYVKDLLSDEPGAADPLGDFDSDFDLNLDDDLTLAEPELKAEDFADDLVLDAPQVPQVPEAPSFDAVLAQQAAAKVEPSDDLADFDLDIASDESTHVPLADDLDAQLAEFDDSLNFTTPETVPPVVADLELPEDFDLSLAAEMDATPEHLASSRADVSAELAALSQSLEQPAIAEPFAAKPESLGDFGDLDDELEFDYLAGTDETATKLDLARAYIDMGDHDGARDILDEVVKEGTEGQQQEAQEMLSRLA